MPRATKIPATRKRKKKYFKAAKGFFSGRRTLYRTVRETVHRAMSYATRDRRDRKAEFRVLWTMRINAACRQFGTTYSRLIADLKKAQIVLDRKSLADLAVRDSEAFQKIVELVSAGRK